MGGKTSLNDRYTRSPHSCNAQRYGERRNDFRIPDLALIKSKNLTGRVQVSPLPRWRWESGHGSKSETPE
jgi:hypothetical protein